MRTRGRITAAIVAVALTGVVALAAIMVGGPLRGLAAPAPAPATVSSGSAVDAGDVADLTAFGFDFTGASASGTPTAGGDIKARCQAFASALATNLNVTPDQLQAALKKTILQQIDAAQAAGTITADQAQTIRTRINGATGDLCDNIGMMAGQGGFGAASGGFGGGMGAGALQGDVLNAAATYFNISGDQLKQDLQSAGSLKAVAAKYGKDNDAGKAGLEAALEGALKQTLTNRGINADMANQIANAFKQNFDRLYTAPIGNAGKGGPMNHHGGPGGIFPGGKGGWPGAHPSATPVN